MNKVHVFIIGFWFYTFQTLTSGASPVLSVYPYEINKSCSEISDTIYISNNGTDTLTWNAYVDVSDTSWISISGSSSGINSGTLIIIIEENNGSFRTGSVVIESNGPSGTPQIVEIIQQNCSYPAWQYNITGSSHTILLQSTTELTIESVPIAIGDYIGVFALDSTGSMICAGYTAYTGNSTIISAWEDDLLTSNKDGFSAGETFTWKLWRLSDGQEFDANASYMPVGGPISNLDEFESEGMSGLISLVANINPNQLISLQAGWSIFSTYIDPVFPGVDSVVSSIIGNVALVKNDDGQVYWPAFGLNMIGDMIIGKGYQIKMLQADTLIVEGQQVIPELTPVIISTGWSIIAYLRDSQSSVVTMLDPVSANTILVKNTAGQVYWLAFGLNMIGDMIPGEGYQIKMSQQDTLVYPPN